MDFIKEWTFNICITLLISVIFSILSPKGSMGKFFKITLAIFIFLSFIYPFKSADINLIFPEFNIEAFENEQENTYGDLICANIENQLEAGGYSSCKADVSINYSQNEIKINRVSVQIPDTYSDIDVKNYIYDELGIVAEVRYLGE